MSVAKGLGLGRLRRGLHKAAKIIYSGITRGQFRASAHFVRGLASTRSGDFAKAEQSYRRAIALAPGRAELYGALGNTLIGAGRAADAIPAFEAALRLQPAWREASYGLAMAELTDCRCERAVAHFRELITADPQHLPYYLSFGAALHLNGCMLEAVSAWSAGMEMQARLARAAGIAESTRYLPGIFTQAIGHIALLDIWAKGGALGLLPATRYVVLAPVERIANRAYLDCWEDHFEIIRGREADLARQAHLADDDATVMWVDGRWMWWLEAGCVIQEKWEAAARTPLLKLSEGQKEKARAALQKLGLPRNAWFVSLHAREGGYYKSGQPLVSRRNAKIADYVPAIRRITDAGGWVVRLGDPSAAKLPDLPQVIDYAHGPRQDWLDIFLLAEARFFIGTNSGPVWAAGTFGVPALQTNWAPMGIQSYFSNTVTMPQLLWSNKEDRQLTFREQMAEPFAWTESARRLSQLDIVSVANTPEEIVAGVEEMLARAEGFWSESPAEKDRQQRFRNLLADAGIAARSRVGNQYLTAHAHLLT